ncbi:acyltransferase [Arthrobacter sp. BHU FT2]|nr:acyltransferase [Arthrobacter sp. BHU FT2]
MPPITAQRTLDRPHAASRAVKTGKRRDIQGLRAIAVGSVLLYHMGFPLIDGGFIGVDVFFVISGFLISGLIIREFQRTGTFSFVGFYARRLKRLAPAYLLVLLVSGIAVMTLLTPLQSDRYVKDLIAAALYAANFNFAAQTSGYFADSDPSPFVHFWSLAVEEQFYFVWPILLFLAFKARRSKHLIVYVLVGVFATSLALSIVLSHTAPTSSYYLLHTRAWELAAGAITFLLTAKIPAMKAWTRGLLLAAGLGTIILSAFFITKSMEFPGSVALFPVLGTMCVILASSGGSMAPFGDKLLGNKPMLFFGNISYALYLWHWPLLVIPQLLTPTPLRLRDKMVLAAVAIVLAVLTYFFVEKRFAEMKGGGRKLQTYVIALGATAALVAAFVGWGLAQQHSVRSAQASSSVTIGADRGGAAQGSFADSLVDSSGRWIPQDQLTPSLDAVDKDLTEIFNNGCNNNGADYSVAGCEFGDRNSSRTVVLFGDSHAGHWFPALKKAAEVEGFRLVTLTKSACPSVQLPITGHPEFTEAFNCQEFQRAGLERIRELAPERVVISNSERSYADFPGVGPDYESQWEAGLAALLDGLPADAKPVIIGDNPSWQQNPNSCVSKHLDDPDRCAVNREESYNRAIQDMERNNAAARGGSFVDTVDLLCGENLCPAVYRSVLMSRDGNHITTPVAQALTSHVAIALR